MPDPSLSEGGRSGQGLVIVVMVPGPKNPSRFIARVPCKPWPKDQIGPQWPDLHRAQLRDLIEVGMQGMECHDAGGGQQIR